MNQSDYQKAISGEKNLEGANLYGANLYGAELRGANLIGADLREAELRRANLRRAKLEVADLRGAKLNGANIRGAKLRYANLRGAELEGAKLPSPTMVLLANWGEVSDELCIKLMRYDCSCHPVGKKVFDLWKSEGSCPYNDCSVQRAANFKEKRELWSYGPSISPYKLMAMVLKEKCKGWE